MPRDEWSKAAGRIFSRESANVKLQTSYLNDQSPLALTNSQTRFPGDFGRFLPFNILKRGLTDRNRCPVEIPGLPFTKTIKPV
jgi:hypothetical protein